MPRITTVSVVMPISGEGAFRKHFESQAAVLRDLSEHPPVMHGHGIRAGHCRWGSWAHGLQSRPTKEAALCRGRAP